LIDDAWTVILVIPSTTVLRARATRSSSSSKVAKLAGGPYTGQGAMSVCFKTPFVRVRSMRVDVSVVVVVVVVVVGIYKGSRRASWAVGRWK